MTINDITINGIDSAGAYYFLNPIFLRITSDTKFITYVTIKLKNRTALDLLGNDLETKEFRLQSNNEGQILVDISDYIKSIAVYPNGYKSKTPQQIVPNSLNDIQLTINVSTREDVGPTEFIIDKLFLYGYKLTNLTNRNITNNSVLNVNNDFTNEYINIPYYNSDIDSGALKTLSNSRFVLNETNKSIDIVQETENNILNHIQVVGCEPILFRFLNSSGGYSYVVFNSYTYTSSSNPTENNVKLNRFFSEQVTYIGQKVDYNKEYTAIQEFDNRFKLFIDEFIRSQYVQVCFSNFADADWLEIDIQQNQLPNISGDSFEIAYKFKLLTSINL